MKSVCATLEIDDRPLVILGMHRSGTSLLARLLERCGVFQGCRLTGNHESEFFQSVDRDLLDLLGCSWAEIGAWPTFEVLRDDLSSLHGKTRKRLLAELLPEHFGPSIGPEARQLWGWKDPRTCLTMPLFADIFPRARIAFLRRDPRDVARSLIVRDEKRYDSGSHPSLDSVQARFRHYVDLWEDYNERATRALELFPLTTATAYESFVRSPREELEAILTGLEVPVPSDLAAVVAEVRSDRAHRFVEDDDPRFRDQYRPGRLAREWYGDR